MMDIDSATFKKVKKSDTNEQTNSMLTMDNRSKTFHSIRWIDDESFSKSDVKASSFLVN